ncbi:J domain-containing protein [Pseudomonas pergaminensis]|uniref:J domain-containing protein n=1 Tax=Pseudomonas pergaminensis TaxID=2853159 RepID=UPI0034D506ED
MSCWEVLGLTRDADTRTIKRQYAVLLKQHRPDEDPSGFQRLREAYEHALEWHRFDAAADSPQPVPVDIVQPATHEADTRGEQAQALIAGATASDLANRYRQAMDSDCADAFEALLLQRCLISADPAFSEWAVTHLHWLSPWQREAPICLPEYRLGVLLEQMFTHVEQRLVGLLDQQQVEAFKAALTELNHTEWLKPLARHARINDLLARTLLASRFWSEALFDTLCAQQAWSDKELENPCPEPEWSQLKARNALERFKAHTFAQASLDSRDAQCRAARLLFGDMPLEQRQRFARRFGEPDWNACRTLSETLLNQFPSLCALTPGGDPYFWRDWERATRPWPMFVALLGMAAGWAVHDQQVTDHTLMETLGMAPTWAFLITIPALMILAIWRPATDGYGEIDDRLAPLSRWLSFRRPSPLFIREILPCWLLGALIWVILGPYAFIGYGVSLQALGIAQRLFGRRG